MKKILMLLLAFTFLFTTSSVFAIDKEINVIKADTFMELDDEGKMLEGDKSSNKKNLSDSYLSLDYVNFSTIDGKIVGSVQYSNQESVGFELSGDLKNRGKQNDMVVIADLTDSLENFEVIHASISNDPSKMNLFDKKRYKKNKKSVNSIMTLILLQKGTRRLTIVEWYNPTINVNEILSNQASLTKAEKEDILWHRKILKTMTKIYEEEERTDTIDIMGYHPVVSSEKTFYNWYEYWGEEYRQQLTIRHGLETTTSLSYSESMGAWIKVIDDQTVCETDPAYSFPDSYLSVGRGSPTLFEFLIQGDNNNAGGDGFKFAEWDAIGETSPGIQFGADIDLSYSVTVPYTPISFSITATGSQDLDLNDTYSSFTNDIANDDLTRSMDVEFNKEYMLSNIDNKFTIDFDVHKYDQTIHNDGKIDFKFSYFVWDQYAYNHDSYSSTLTGYYISD